MQEKLKPCPFCGGKPDIREACGHTQVYCTECGANNVWSYAARTLWNKRTRRDTDLKPCPICGKKGRVFESYDRKYCVQCSGCTLTTAHCQTPEEAKAIWNRRAGAKT